MRRTVQNCPISHGITLFYFRGGQGGHIGGTRRCDWSGQSKESQEESRPERDGQLRHGNPSSWSSTQEKPGTLLGGNLCQSSPLVDRLDIPSPGICQVVACENASSLYHLTKIPGPADVCDPLENSWKTKFPSRLTSRDCGSCTILIICTGATRWTAQANYKT